MKCGANAPKSDNEPYLRAGISTGQKDSQGESELIIEPKISLYT